MFRKKLCFLFAALVLLALLPPPAAAADEFVIVTNSRNGSVTLTGYNGSGGHVVIPDGVTTLGRDVFKGNTGIASVVMPDSVTYMDDGVFSGCTALTSVQLSKNLTNISKGAFYECASLAEITLGDKITSIGSSAFMECDALVRIDIPDSVRTIDGNAFYKCDGLKTAVIGNGVTTIGTRAFADCPALADVYMGTGLTSIQSTAFSGIGGMTVLRTFYGEPGTYAETFAWQNNLKFGSTDAPPAQASVFPKPTTTVALAQNPGYVDLTVQNAVYDHDPDSYTFSAAVSNLQTVIRPNGNINVLHRETDAQGKFTIYEYSPKMERVGAAEFTPEFSQIGAFARDSAGNYYIFYADAVPKSDSGVVNLALVRYSPTGQKQKEYRGRSDLDGAAGVMVPFSSGNCRMEISGDVIAVYFARTMFNGHQASLGMFFDLNMLSLLNIGAGRSMSSPYVSHSFDQFILPTDAGFAFVDHGDAAPRGFVFNDAERRVLGNNHLVPFDFYNPDPTYQTPALYNQTFAEMGGLAETDSGYLFAGTYDKSRPSEGVRNLFLLTMDRRMTAAGSPIWITSYTATDANSPRIVRIGQDEYLLLWRADRVTYMAVVSGSGTVTTPVTPIPGVTINANDVLRYNPVTGLVHWAVPGGDVTTIRLYGFDPRKTITSIEAPAAPAGPLTAAPNASAVRVNGVKVDFDAYTINENNYFKLRDLAFVLSGTDKQFEVKWDEASNAILLFGGRAYTVVGGEMEPKSAGSKTPVPTASKTLLDGAEVFFTAYTIDQNNYFKLRDIGRIFDFSVVWDGAANAILIDTTLPYVD